MTFRSRSRTLGGGIIVLAAPMTLLVAGCASSQRSEMKAEQTIGPGKLTVYEVQAEVLGYADNFASLIAEGADQLQRRITDPAVRADVHAQKLGTILGAYTIATEANPIAAVIDITVLATLTRTVVEDYWIPQVYGEAGAPLLDACRRAESAAYTMGRKVLDEAQIEELKATVVNWRETHPNQRFVSHVRFDDLAPLRGKRVAGTKQGGGSLLGLVGLDPLANLDPTTREIEQSRLLAERMFFFVARLPFIIGWQAELLVYRTAATSETQQIVADVDRFATVAERFADSFDELPDVLTAQREALLNDLRVDEGDLRGTLAELRQTIDAGTVLSGSLQTTLGSVDALATKFERDTPSRDTPPVELADVQGTIQQTTVAAAELTTLVESVDRVLSATEPDQRLAELEGALALAEASGLRLLNRVFFVGAGLLGILVVGAVLIVVLRR